MYVKNVDGIIGTLLGTQCKTITIKCYFNIVQYRQFRVLREKVTMLQDEDCFGSFQNVQHLSNRFEFCNY